jgi:multiple sugar transport system permease protein
MVAARNPGRPSALLERIFLWADRHSKYIFVAPAIVLLIALIAFPLFYLFDLSLRDVSILNIRSGEAPYVGLGNYADVTVGSASMGPALLRTMIFAGWAVSIQLLFGLGLALVFNRQFVGKNLIMTLILVPILMTPVVIGIFWQLLLNAEWGLVNELISFLGISPQVWLGNPTLAMVSVIGVEIWWGTPFVTLILLGGLSALPQDPYEAAAIDGASAWQSFQFITLPLLAPILMIAALIRTIDAFRAFDIIYVLTGGGPGTATRVFALEIFETAFQRSVYGTASTQAVVLMLVILVFTALLLRRLGQRA